MSLEKPGNAPKAVPGMTPGIKPGTALYDLLNAPHETPVPPMIPRDPTLAREMREDEEISAQVEREMVYPPYSSLMDKIRLDHKRFSEIASQRRPIWIIREQKIKLEADSTMSPEEKQKRIMLLDKMNLLFTRRLLGYTKIKIILQENIEFQEKFLEAFEKEMDKVEKARVYLEIKRPEFLEKKEEIFEKLYKKYK